MEYFGLGELEPSPKSSAPWMLIYPPNFEEKESGLQKMPASTQQELILTW